MIARAIPAAFLYGLPHMALAYYITEVVLDKLFTRRRSALTITLFILLPYAAAICAVIFLARLFILPHIYEGIVTPQQAFFNAQKFFSIMIEAAFPAALLMAVKFVKTQLATKEREKNLIKEKLTAELQSLKNQLNPHFLFNTLNNIYALTRKKSDLAPEAVMKLSDLLSFILYEANQEQIPLSKEIQFLEDYIDIQKMRYSNGLTISFSKEVDHTGETIAPLLLLPLVENAFKHGASENHYDSFISLRLHIQAGKLSFEVKNSIETPATFTEGKGIGLANLKRQLEMLYKGQALTISKTDTIFTAHLFVNMDTYGKN